MGVNNPYSIIQTSVEHYIPPQLKRSSRTPSNWRLADPSASSKGNIIHIILFIVRLFISYLFIFIVRLLFVCILF